MIFNDKGNKEKEIDLSLDNFYIEKSDEIEHLLSQSRNYLIIFRYRGIYI